MRKTSKPLAVAMCALVVALGVNATVAWLTDESDEVVNTFTAGDINIALTETQNLDLKMVPGDTIAKDPTVTVEAESEACWLFVQVKEADNSIGGVEFIEWSVDTAQGEWTKLGETANGVSTYYRAVPATGSEAVSFNVLETKEGYEAGYVTVNGDATKEMMDAVDGLNPDGSENSEEKQPELIFKAFAVQQANIESVDEAWSQIPETERLK